ncbi:protein-L-isoaspartate O-methyltransferase family protein [Sphingobium algorifonticola]|uniref:protein-L-isoaspartate O-methyltransferase family protein n=1 Tax=Sphingobium algorifonticola TaxID=2008318 RepID=UPI0026CA2477
MVTEPNFAAMRAAMVENQLRTSDVNDVRVIAAMAQVPREAFVPVTRQAMAYIDRPVPLADGRALNPPLATGRLLTEAAVRRGEKVLLVGAATGYTAALLAAMGAQVTAVDDAALLTPDGTSSVAPLAGVTLAPGTLAGGAPANGPYAVIIIDGAIEEVPGALVEQLGDGGRMATGLIDKGVTRLAIGRKSGDAFGLTHVADIEMVVLPGFARPKTFVF